MCGLFGSKFDIRDPILLVDVYDEALIEREFFEKHYSLSADGSTKWPDDFFQSRRQKCGLHNDFRFIT